MEPSKVKNSERDCVMTCFCGFEIGAFCVLLLDRITC